MSTLVETRPSFAPGPPARFLVGNLPDQKRLGMLGFYRSLYDTYGDLVRFKMGPLMCHLVSRPEHIEHILLKHKERYEKGVGVRKLKLIMGDGLFLSEGEFWRSQRKLMQPPFTPRGVAQFAECVLGAAERLGERCERARREGVTLDLQQQMMRLALDVVSQAMFGSYLDEQVTEIAKSFTYVLEYVSERSIALVDVPLFVPTASNRRFKKAHADITQFLGKLIDERRAKRPARDDLLTRLIDAADEDSGQRMSDQQLKDEVVTLFFAGHETTAQALTWLWIALGQNPEVRQKLESELDRELAGRPPTFGDLSKLTYTRAVVDEAMRLYPPVWMFVRQSLVPDDLSGYHVERGSLIMLSPYLVQRDAKHFPEPEAFRPERFLAGAEPPIQPYTYFPFGAGPRVCIGNNFALLEMVLTVASLAQRFHFEVTSPEPIQVDPRATLRPDKTVLVRVEARGNPSNRVSPS